MFSDLLLFYMVIKHPLALIVTLIVICMLLAHPNMWGPQQPLSGTHRHDAEVAEWNLRESHEALLRQIREVDARRAAMDAAGRRARMKMKK